MHATSAESTGSCVCGTHYPSLAGSRCSPREQQQQQHRQHRRSRVHSNEANIVKPQAHAVFGESCKRISHSLAPSLVSPSLCLSRCNCDSRAQRSGRACLRLCRRADAQSMQIETASRIEGGREVQLLCTRKVRELPDLSTVFHVEDTQDRTAVVPFALARNMPKAAEGRRSQRGCVHWAWPACRRAKCKRVPSNLRRHLVSINATATATANRSNFPQLNRSACPKQTLIANH